MSNETEIYASFWLGGHCLVCILGKGTWALFPRLPRGALNRGAVCVRMHLRSCTDVKEPGWPSESLGVQKQTDRAGMHKRPEDGMWLPTGGQIGNGHIRVSSLAQGERCKQVSKQDCFRVQSGQQLHSEPLRIMFYNFGLSRSNHLLRNRWCAHFEQKVSQILVFCVFLSGMWGK